MISRVPEITGVFCFFLDKGDLFVILTLYCASETSSRMHLNCYY